MEEEAERAIYFNASPKVLSDKPRPLIGVEEGMCVSAVSEVCKGHRKELGNGYKGIGYKFF